MAKKQFKAESKRMLDLMINSIYTNKDIFLRELISNASDALDKRYYHSLTNEDKVDRKDLKITLDINKEARVITLSDTGIGMTKEELDKNLGTIARSGSLEFKEQLEKAEKNVDIIGQFGVGFYSAFMVAKKIVVESRKFGEAEAYKWVSEGEDGYTITPCEKDEIGTTITLFLKDDSEEVNYSHYLEEYEVKQLVRKYSDYVRYPIEMECEVTRAVEGDKEGKTETVKEVQTLNSMVPLWKKPRKDVSEEEYNDFYKSKFMDWEDPQKVLHYNVEGNISYTALMFIPAKTPYNFYSSEYEQGLQLYSKGVFIMDKAKDLIPDYFRFVKGLVDSDDLNLNISREILQQDRQMQLLRKSVEKKIKGALEDMLKNDRENYEKFFDNFGLQLKFGIYQDYGMHKDVLQDLILFKSSKEDKYVTLKEAVEHMQEGQDVLYYACGSNINAIKSLPQMEKLNEKGIEVLYFTDDVDEFAINVLGSYADKKFKSVNQGELDLDSEEEKKEKEQLAKENASLLTAMKAALEEKVKEVRISSRLKSHPVCLVSDEGLSLDMEKVLNQGPLKNDVKATRILEINPDHDLFKTLQKVYSNKPELIHEYADVLYDQALLMEGLPIEDAVAYSNKVCKLMIDANQD